MKYGSNKHTNNMTNIHFRFKEQGIDKVFIEDVGCNTCSGCSSLAHASANEIYDNIRWQGITEGLQEIPSSKPHRP
jgi:hypothetical protein